ncbi:MAG: hypothetical protein H0X24_15420 [Ktedonobacterales bacterium]|nr:hypothetical protein [Ktedonobacterales bacterium]
MSHASLRVSSANDPLRPEPSAASIAMPNSPQRRPAGIPHPAHLLGVRDQPIGLTELIRPYRARRGDPCPLCGRTSECFALPDPQRGDLRHVYCTRGAHYPDALQWDGFGFKGGIWYVPFIGAVATPHRTPVTKRPTFHAAPVTVQDRVLRKIARYFGLSAEHRARLAARGYDPDRCGPEGPNLFASLPANPGARAQVIIELLAHSETWQNLQGVFGMAYDRRLADSPLYFLPRVTGTALIEFTLDANGLVWGFQYAPDMPEVDEQGKVKKRLSANGMTIAEHYHCTLLFGDDGATLWHTEGIHKANLVAAHYHQPAVAALGAGNLRGLIAAAHDLDPDQQRHHIIALDADMWGKDLALAQTLHEMGFTVALARWDGTAAKGPDDALLAGLPITPLLYEPAGKPRTVQRLLHTYHWQRHRETPAEQQARLAAIGVQIQRDVTAHIDSNSKAVQVIVAPPGVGKSTAVAQLAQEYNLSVVVQRHDMMGSNPNLRAPLFRHILTATAQTCPDGWPLHRALVQRGYLTEPAHAHAAKNTCLYRQQWDMQWPSVYQINHLVTPFPAGHRAIIIDECDVASWLPERRITVGDIHATNNRYPAGSTTSQFLSVLQVVLTDIGQVHHADPTAPLPSGATVFDAIDARCQGQLAVLLAQMDRAFPQRPAPPQDVTLTNPQAVARAEGLPRVVLPHLIAALLAELPRWQRGQPFNSRIRVGPVGDGMAFYLTEPRTFTAAKDGTMPPRVLLDATADPTLLSRLWDAPVVVRHYDVDPPAHMRHIAVRTGKRYGKISLTAQSHARDRARVVAELRYLLADLDPDGALMQAGKIGLVTFAACEDALGEALGIPDYRRRHFWATRGSNALEACEILLVVGTPALAPNQVIRLAEALYWHEVKINPRCEEGADGHWHYVDPRCQALADSLINAELTQCAHRNRPLRHDGRIVVTLCQGEIANLPPTTTITSLPQLTADGEERRTASLVDAETRIQAAIAELHAAGQPVTVRTLARRTRLQIAVVGAALRRWRFREAAIARLFPVLHFTTTASPETLRRMGGLLPLTTPLIGPPTAPPQPFRERLAQWIDAGISEDEAIPLILAERAAVSGDP